MSKIIAIVQARTDSTRLPGKVLKNILDKPMIIHQLQRIQRSNLIDKIILSTSNEKSDDHLANIILKYNFSIYRGDKNNVLKRFFDSVKDLNLNDNDIIVRITGDCPLLDATIIDESIENFLKQSCDYLANCIEPIYPDGFDVEIMTYNALKIAFKEATKASDLEHVTPYIRNTKQFNFLNLKKEPVHPNWRLTVDEDVDLKLIEKIYEHFNNNTFSFNDIIYYLENNRELLKLNNTIQRNEGYLKSLKKEQNAR